VNDIDDIEVLIADADSEFPALFQLFGGYFHEDWRADYTQPGAALAAFTAEAPPEAVREAAAELERLLGAGLDDAVLSRLLDAGFACNYVPSRDGLTSTAWLGEVRAALRPPGGPAR